MDAILLADALSVAYALRFEFAIPAEKARDALVQTPFVVGIQLLAAHRLGVYRVMSRYVGLTEMRTFAIAGGLSAVPMVAVRLLAPPGRWIMPMSVIALATALGFGLMLAVRIARRMHYEARSDVAPDPDENIPTLVIGAGDAARRLLGDLRKNSVPWNVVGLLDDDPAKQGGTILGVPVIGPTTDLEHQLRTQGILHVVIAMPSANREVISELLAVARRNNATAHATPPVNDIVTGRGTYGKPRLTILDLTDSKEIHSSLLPSLLSEDREQAVLVTGGAGYIGSHLVRKLLDGGYRVRVLDNFLNGDRGLASLRGIKNLQVVEGDIANIRDVVASLKDVGTVYGLAAIVGDAASSVDPEETLNLNYESTKVLVEACNFYEVRRLVFASSCSVYGASDHALLTEESPVNPVSLYARTRIMSENVILEQSDALVPVILRLGSAFGYSPRMRFDLVLNALTARAVVEGKINIMGGEQWRPFVHCEDAADAFYLAGRARDDRVAHKIFNVGHEEGNHTIADVGRVVAEEIPGTDIEVSDPGHDLRNYRVSFERIRDALGFMPTHDLRSGVRRIVQALEEEPELRDYANSMYSNHKVMTDRAAGLENASIPTRS